MTDAPTTPPSQQSSALQAVWPGVSLVGLVWLVIAVTGILPEAELWMAALGLLVASVTATGAAWIHLRMFGQTEAAGMPILAQARVTRVLATGFAAKLVMLSASVFVLVALEVKFPSIAAFALAFTAASLIVQLWSAVLVTRTASRPIVQPLHRS